MKLILPGGRAVRFLERDSSRFNIDQWITDYLIPAQQFNYQGHNYPIGLNQTMVGASKTKEITNSLPGFTAALRKSPPAFAAEMVRALVLSQARFTFRYRLGTSTPRKMFGTPALAQLENPWPNATTGELISRMEWHAGLAGNSFVTDFEPRRLRVLRPDWTAIVHGSQLEPEDPMGALDGEVVGYVYQNGGLGSGNKNEARTLRPSEVAHWSPLPDPLSPGLGMSWITPALRDIQGDNLSIEHKVKYYENGATPNLVMTGVPGVTPTQFEEWVNKFGKDHTGLGNAYRTMYLTIGMDAKVVGSNLQELDFAQTGGYSETRISFLSRVPAALLGISAGLKGSSLNAGNYAETRRTFTDTWVYPTLQDLCKALAPLVEVPPYAELWFDTTDMPILRDDAEVAAGVEKVKQETIVGYMNVGFTPKSVVAAVRGQDISLLEHDPSLVSVQLQPPAGPSVVSMPGNAPGNGSGQPAARSLSGLANPSPVVHNHYINVPERSITIQAPQNHITVPERPVTVENHIQTPKVQIPVTVNVPPDEPDPSPGVTIERDRLGNVTGVTRKAK